MAVVALYCLALCGAALGAAGDFAGVLALKSARPAPLHLLGCACWVGCYPVWVALTRRGGGFTGPVSAWSIASAILTASIALWLREPQSRLRWIGLALILTGAVVSALGARE